jgi:hypothetical protein
MDYDTGTLLNGVMRGVLITNQRVNVFLDMRTNLNDFDQISSSVWHIRVLFA